MALAGVPMTCGSRILEGYVPSRDAVVVERLLTAGAEIVAITNMDDLAFSGGGDSSAYGATLCPFDLERTAGGSSGGSAAALWYEGVDAGLGTDQGGSIRVPAAWCGVVGLKPTHGLVPYAGIVGIDRTFDHAGPMARSVEAAARLLDVIAPAAGAARPLMRPRGISAACVSASSPKASARVWAHRRSSSRPSRRRSSGSVGWARRSWSARCPSTSRPAGSPSPASSRA